MATIPVRFRLIEINPGSHNYNRPVLEPVGGLEITMDVPLKHEYISNAEQIIQAQLAGDMPQVPVLNAVEGLAYIERVFLDRHNDKTVERLDYIQTKISVKGE